MLLSDLVVISQEPILVAPADPTPNVVLSLSNLDSQTFLRFTIEYIFVYKAEPPARAHGDRDPVETVRNALSRALVPYYPMAGRLRNSHDGSNNLEVVCNGAGALFVRASANLTLNEFDQFHKPSKSWKKLLCNVAADSSNFLGIPPLIVQVTRLRCGAFVFCVGITHCLCDGLGSSQFLHAWSEISRGLDISLTPCWDRHLLQTRNPPRVECPHPEFTQVEDFCNLKYRLRAEVLVPSSVCFDPAKLLEMKDFVRMKCTSFEILSAHVWRSWIRAMELPPRQTIKLLFTADVRQRLKPNLPQGFYGNGFVLACCQTTVKDLTEKSLSFAVKLVQRAKERLTNEYVRSIIDVLRDSRRRPDVSASLIISQWSRLGLTGVDFGWGRPLHVGNLCSDIYCILLPLDPKGEAVNVVLSVPRNVFVKYEYYMRNISD